jgi:hypothetical protein
MPSTVIRSFKYDPANRVLTVVFQTGRTYQYLDVPPELPRALRSARSKGAYFNREIRGTFDFVEIG